MQIDESDILEYKEKLTDSLEKEVIAFLNNKQGGDIYIGIKNDGTIIGVDKCDEVQLQIKDRLKNNIEPSVLGLYDIKCLRKGDKQYIKLIVASGSEKPYYLKAKGMSENGCFMRIGSAAQKMPKKMIDELFESRIKKTLANIESPRQKLSFAQLEIYYQAKGFTINDEFYYNLDLLTPDEKFNFVAFLCADTNNISFKFGKYASLDKCDLIENVEYGYQSIIKATDEILSKLKVENRIHTRITSGRRIDTPMIDEKALREAVLNAIVHNNYFYGNAPVFELYPNRLEITSNGGLGYFYTEDEFFRGRSNPRNRELMRIFKDLGYVEEMGSGVQRILTKYPKKIFEMSQNYITIIFPFDEKTYKIFDQKSKEKNGAKSTGENFVKSTGENGSKDNNTAKVSKKSTGENLIKSTGENKLKSTGEILALLLKNPTITIPQISLALHITSSAVEKNIRKLKKEKLIERIGSNKTGHWKVIK